MDTAISVSSLYYKMRTTEKIPKSHIILEFKKIKNLFGIVRCSNLNILFRAEL